MAQASAKVTNFPVPSATRPQDAQAPDVLSLDADPTKEIRTLIEQLQDTSKDARARQRMAEEERDRLSTQLEKIQADMDAAEALSKSLNDIRTERDRLREQTEKYGEILADLKRKADTSEKEKAAALKERDELARFKATTQKQVEEIVRQRESLRKESEQTRGKLDELSKRFSDLQRELAEARKQAADSAKSGGENQKQVMALRQARDAAAAQVAEYKSKISSLEDELAELSYQRDGAEKKAEHAASELPALKEKVESLQAKLDSGSGRIAALEAELTAKSESLATAQNESADIAAKLTGATEEIATLKSGQEALTKSLETAHSERDEALQKAQSASDSNKALSEELATLRTAEEKGRADLETSSKALETLRAETDSLRKERDDFSAKAEEASSSLKSLSAELESAREAAEKAKTEADEIRKENERIALEREREIAEFTTRLDSLRAAHESELGVARQQYEASLKERDLARQRAQEKEAESEQLCHKIASLQSTIDASAAVSAERDKRESEMSEKLDALQKNDTALTLRTSEAERKAETAIRERDTIAQSLDEARNSLISVQRQMEFIIGDRDSIREKATTESSATAEQLASQRDEISRLKKELETVEPRLSEYAKLVDRFERQRLETIELSVLLENAQRDIKEMGASLAEARLMAKNAERRAIAGVRPLSVPFVPAEPATIPQGDKAPGVSVSPAILELVAQMRQSFQDFTRRPGDLKPLNELCNHAQAFSEQVRDANHLVIHRVSSSFASLLHELHVMPEQVSPAMLRTINQTIEFVSTLLKQPNLDRFIRLDSARVYVVDDEHEICESIAGAMRAVGLTTKTTQMPGEAVGELAGCRYDLVVLDVHLPELNGFELCTHIRNMALHTETPIVFLTGNASMENRMQSSQRGGNDFVTKPFSFQELGLKALTLILRSQLKML